MIEQVPRICEIHGEYTACIFRTPYGQIIEAMCPLCDASKDAELETVRLNAEKKAQEEYAARRNKAANIEPAYHHATFDTFQANTPELKHALAKFQDLIAGTVKKILMTGKNGTGKTHLACAAIHHIGKGRIMTMYEISTAIRASYTYLATKTELEIVDELATLPILAIDEIGRTKGGDAETNWLSYILDKRHVRELPTVLISNNHVRKDCPEQAGCPKCLENYIGEDIMSRLSEKSVLLRFTGEDWRKKRF